MNDNNFDEIFAWGKEQGLKLNSRVARLCVDGLYGMYASSDIPKHTILGQYPKNKAIPLLNNVKYPKDIPFQPRYIHAAAKELSKGKSSSWAPFMKGLYSDAFFESTNVYYFSEEEVNFVEKVNYTLSEYIRDYRKTTTAFIDYWCDFDKDLDREVFVNTMFNYRYRGWGNIGFVPILDMFNHSSLDGIQIQEDQDNVYLVAMIDYKEGDQIWINYGQKDLYLHAIDYGYFDPDGTHLIDLGLRLTQSAKNDLQKKVFNYIKNKYPIASGNANDGSIHYKIQQGNAFLLDYAPNMQAIDFVRDISFQTDEELSARKCPDFRFRNRMLSYINVLNTSNKVDEYTVEDFPDKMKYLYHMLKKEKSMFASNRDWAMMSCGQQNRVPHQMLIPIS